MTEGAVAGVADESAAVLHRRLAAPVHGGSGTVVGVGIDAVDIERFRTVLARRPTLARRLFTPAEQEYAGRIPDPVPRLATRFATKEAVLKALGLGLGAFGFHDVEVVRPALDAPELVLRGAAADASRAAGVARWYLSLTHTDLVAMAAVVADGPTGAGSAGR